MKRTARVLEVLQEAASIRRVFVAELVDVEVPTTVAEVRRELRRRAK